MITVAVYVGGHDGSITVLENEKILLHIAEERISKIKHNSSLPFLSLKKIANTTKHIDNLIILGTKHPNIITSHLEKLKITISNITIPPLSEHHIFHAASGFYSSGFKEALCLTIDGFGGVNQLLNTADSYGFDTTQIYYINSPTNFKKLYSNWNYSPQVHNVQNIKLPPNTDLNYNLDIGMIYSAVCVYLGWNVLSGGKLMGLSSYGKPNSNLPSVLINNSLYGNMNLFKPDQTITNQFYPIIKEAHNNFSTTIAKDLAYATQQSFEKVIFNRIQQAQNFKPSKNIILSGGCALNVMNNYKLKKKFPNINFYIDPLGSDVGQSLGASLYYYYQSTNSKKQEPLKHLYHGPRYSKEDLLNSIKKYV